MRSSTRRHLLAFASVIGLCAFQAGAVVAQAPSADSGDEAATVIVTGTREPGVKARRSATPIDVISASDLKATGATNLLDALRDILPSIQAPAVGYDVGALARTYQLRGLSPSHTLVLINGKRRHLSASLYADSDPAQGANAVDLDLIPLNAIERVEVLRDGAAAQYGSDAIAGVVNVITTQNMNGLRLSAQHGQADGTHYNTSTLSAVGGSDFLGGRANITASFSYTQETALRAADEPFSATSNLTSQFANTPYAGLASLNGNSTVSPWGTFTLTPATTAKSGATTVTTASGQFHIQPVTDAGCALATSSGNCIGTGPQATSTTAANTRADNLANYNPTVTPSVNRYNFFSNAHYDIDNHVTIYAEAGWYEAESQSLTTPSGASGSSTVTIPASNYWNPFGPTTSPNRLPNLTGVPAAGEAVRITSYQFGDQGTNVVRDWGHQGRILLGAKGDDLFGFNWDTAILYSEAGNRDLGEGINETLLQQNLALSTSAAYNPFLGGNSSNPSGPMVTTASNAAAVRSFTTYYRTDDYSTLGLWDFKVSKADLFSLPAGNLGLASGVEVRHESLADIRDPNINGTNQFRDSVTGTTIVSNILGVSQTPSTKGDRWVESVYGELGVPVISPAMGIPLVEKFDMQLAGRYENFSDVGGVAKPKVAFSWDVNDSFRIRGSWSQGFEAPNLIQEHETLLSRSNSNQDYIFCQADLNAGRINSFANCSESTTALGQRAGNPNLKPETSDNKSIGFVFQPTFLPSEFGEFTLTADYWSILEKNLIGVFGQANALITDYAARMQGTTDPNVVRAAPTVTQIAQFAGTGIAPVGTLLYINDQYVNENPQLASGIDLDAHWSIRDTKWGSFSVDLNVARQLSLKLEPSPQQQALLSARANGIINAGTVISGFGNLLEQNTNPVMKWNMIPTWNDGPWTIGGMISYIGGFNNTSLLNTANIPYRVSPQLTGNVFGEVAFKDGVIGEDARLRVGVRNVSNVLPPVALGNTYGFVGGLYEPYGRFGYISLTEDF